MDNFDRFGIVAFFLLTQTLIIVGISLVLHELGKVCDAVGCT